MGWGSFLGSVGSQAGLGPMAELAGTGFDLYQSSQRRNRDEAQTAAFQQAQLQNARERMDFARQEQADSLAMRNRLIQQSEDLKAANDQIADYLGLPYTPTQEDIMNDTMALSGIYTNDIMKLATLNQSKSQANLMANLGGGDSAMARAGINQGIVDEYAPQLQKARYNAQLDAMKLATSRMDLDNKSRANISDFYGTPINDQFNREKMFYTKAGNLPSGEFDTLAEAASKGYASSTKDMAKYLDEIGSNITTPTSFYDGQSIANKLGSALGMTPYLPQQKKKGVNL